MRFKSTLLLGSLFVLGFTPSVLGQQAVDYKTEFIRKNVPPGRDFNTPYKNMNYHPERLLVRFAPKSRGTQRTRADKSQVLSFIGGGATLKHEFKTVPGLTLVKLPAGQSVKGALKKYNAQNEILYAEPDYAIPFAGTEPNDVRFDELWHMNNTGQTGGLSDADIDAPEAWDIITDTNSIIIGILDSGIDYNHEDLAANIWINNAEFSSDPNAPSDLNSDG